HEADLAVIQACFLAALDSGSLDRAELLDQSEARRQLKLEALRGLVSSGTIIRSGSGKKAEPYRYSRSDRGDFGSPGSANIAEPEFSFSSSVQKSNVYAADCGSQVPVPTEPATETQDEGDERFR